jgi:hypothetical protein
MAVQEPRADGSLTATELSPAKSEAPLPLNVSETPLKELLDIALMAVLVYGVLVWLRHTKRSSPSLALRPWRGVLLARQAGLALTAWGLQGFVVVAAVLLVVAFSADLRRGLERMALPALGRRRKTRRQAQETVVRAILRAGRGAARRPHRPARGASRSNATSRAAACWRRRLRAASPEPV